MNVFYWVIGVFIFFLAVNVALNSIVNCIPFALASIIALPATFDKINSRNNINSAMRNLAILILVILGYYIIGLEMPAFEGDDLLN